MAMPAQIRKQVEATTEFYKQQQDAVSNGEGEGLSSANEEQSQVGSQKNEVVADVNAEENAPQSPVEEHKTGESKESEEVLAQKYRTLQGMYNAEVPRLHSQNRDLVGRVQQLEQLLATMSAQSTPAQPQVTQQPFITQKDIDEYGESIDVMRKVSREEVSNLQQKIASLETYLQQVQTSVVPQVQAVAQRQAMSAEQQFWSELHTNVPNWREVNDNPGFQSWLLDIDPLTNISRQTYLEDAQRNLDASRVATFFKTWLTATGQVSNAQSVSKNVSSELEKQVAPGRSRSAGSATAAGTEGRTYSPDDIKAFFNDVRQGKYRGRETERARIERDIFAAQAQGRIVNA